MKMKVAKLIEKAKHIALNRITYYDNTPCENLGMYHADCRMSFDCWNTIKALIWTDGEIANNYTVGEFAHLNPDTGLGDWDGYTMLQHCTEVSKDFVNKKVGSLLITPNYDHAGLYVGDFEDPSGVVNVIETTVDFFGNGCTTSYVDEKGNRYDHKGGHLAQTKWAYIGLMTEWVDYTLEYKTVDDLITGVINGDFGNYPDRKENIYRYIQDMVNKRV